MKTSKVIGYVFKNTSFGFVKLPQSKSEHVKLKPHGEFGFVGGNLNAATIFKSQATALDQLQLYTRNTEGGWCSNLELMVVDEIQTVSTVTTQAARQLA